ncbi:polyadenylate-binding protein RBP47-like isoform X2 [Mercurialis annua]|uniref:polyadenylate-binding protein RBP47-like isoform X2 n=1 Tax=Mercurialis annua TaxID=3986 RepID=UPI00215FF8FC|nr:polyadenylate-binding protein RBP47-like isoform X2 [Mercurialis annua]
MQQTHNASDATSAPSPQHNQNQQQQQQQWNPHMQQQQQHYMAAMQYPAAAMVMMQQQMMMYPQQHHASHPYMGYYQQQQPHQLNYHHHKQQHYHKHNQHKLQQYQHVPTEDSKTVWVGDLLHWMDETYLHTCFSHTGEVSAVKVIRNKQTGQPEGYGFIEFYSHAAADKVLQNYNGSMMPNTDQPFRLNWASFAGERRSETGSDLSIFVGDLAADVTDTMLQETFSSKYPSVKGAKVVTDLNSGRSKGYGFVRFGDENERSRAMTDMNGIYCSSRPMRIGVATPKKSNPYQQQYSSQGGHALNGAMVQGSQSDGDSSNTTIFVGGIDSDISDEDLRQPFSQFGEVVSVKIPVGKGCGFVQFADRKSAEDALESLNGTTIGKQTVRLSWGRSPANKQWRGEHNNQWNGSYYGGQGYSGYGYAANGEQNGYVAAAASGAS